MSENFNTKTASLKAVTIDVRKLDAKNIDVKKINLNGKELDNIEYEDKFNQVSTPYDLRRGVLITNEDGTKIIKNLYCPTNVKMENGAPTRNGWCNDDSADVIAQIVDIKNGLATDQNNNILCYFESNELVSCAAGILPFQGSNYVQLTNQWILGSLFTLHDSQYNQFYCIENQLKTFNSPLTNLINGFSMFSGPSGSCEFLEEFESNLPNLLNGSYMFAGTSLKKFDIDMPLLEIAQGMFDGTNNYEETQWNAYPKFESFSSSLDNLKDSKWMFHSCSDLVSFSSNLSRLERGMHMFTFCTSLKNFESPLSSLVNGANMFVKCILSADSLMVIMDTIRDIKSEQEALAERVTNGETAENVYKDVGWQENGDYIIECLGRKQSINQNGAGIGIITIGLGIENTDEARLQMAKDVLCNSWEEVEAEFTNKGWTVQWLYNGSSSANTLDSENDNSPVWVKVEEVFPETLEDGTVIPPRCNYCSEDGTKKYMLNWFHSTNGSTEGYQYFGSLLEACGYYGIIPVRYLGEN